MLTYQLLRIQFTEQSRKMLCKQLVHEASTYDDLKVCVKTQISLMGPQRNIDERKFEKMYNTKEHAQIKAKKKN